MDEEKLSRQEPQEEKDPRADAEFVLDIPLGGEKPEAPPAPKASSSQTSEAYGWLQAVVTAIVLVVLVFTFFVRIIRVDGSSMFPTLFNNDRVFILNSVFVGEYDYGDVVVLRQDTFRPSPS